MKALIAPQRQPIAAFWYLALGPLLLAMILLLFGLFVASVMLVEPNVLYGYLGGALIAAAALIAGYSLLRYLLFTYKLTESTITVNSGVIFRQHETIHFSKAQAVDNERGPLLMLFGLTLVEVWTASADQFSPIGEPSVGARPRPDMTLVLRRDDARTLKDLISRGDHTAAHS